MLGFFHFILNSQPTDPWCYMLQTLLGHKKYEETMSDEHPPLLFLYGLNRQYECDVTWFWFCFSIGYYSKVCLSFQVVQVKQVDCKMRTKNVNNYRSKTFHDIFGQLHTQQYKKKQKADSETSPKWKEVKAKPTKLMSLYWKRKPT